jgi:hypothetical protein
MESNVRMLSDLGKPGHHWVECGSRMAEAGRCWTTRKASGEPPARPHPVDLGYQIPTRNWQPGTSRLPNPADLAFRSDCDSMGPPLMPSPTLACCPAIL